MTDMEQIFSIAPFRISRQQLCLVLMMPDNRFPEIPDFWRFNRRTYAEKMYPDLHRGPQLMPQKDQLAQYRSDMEAWLDGLLEELTPDDRILVDSFVGAGKTFSVAKVLNEKQYKQVWFVESHERADEIVREHFSDLMVRQLTLPYHQPPEPPTFQWLNDEFGQFLDLLPN